MKLSIELFYTEQDQLKKCDVNWCEGMTVQDVLHAVDHVIPYENGVGIFGKKVSLDSLVQPGMRLEVYQALRIDPKEARRKRAAEKLSKK